MNDRLVAEWRLHVQGLATRPFTRPEAALRWMLAVQAQDHDPAKWSIAQRTAACDEAAIDSAIASGTILRTHVLRPTWHFVPAEDIAWLQALTAPRVHAANAALYRREGLDPRTIRRATDIIARALEGQRHLTRDEIAGVLRRNRITAAGQRLAYTVMSAELDGVICSGTPRGRKHTYALVAERVPNGAAVRRLDGEEALAELARRYFSSRGPATIDDFRWWSSATAAAARLALALIEQELEQCTIAGRNYWFTEARPTAGRTLPSPAPVALLLQAYDEYAISYRESRGVIDTAGLRVQPVGRAASFPHMVVIDGQFAGHWRRAGTPGKLRIDVRPARRLRTKEAGALEDAAVRYAAYAGVPLQLAVEAVSDRG